MKVVLCWHMHQPEYRDLHSGEFQLPWTYLHGIKDYVDMAAHLEAHPGARAVVNFAPVLLDQIEDYCTQIDAYFNSGALPRDPLLQALVTPPAPAAPPQPVTVAQLLPFVRANRRRVIERFPAYAHLASMVRWLEQHPDDIIYVAPQLVSDLAVWYHLGWIGETVRRSDERIGRLQARQRHFSLQERNELLQVMLEQLRSIVPRYRALAAAGRIELALSPYAHPILPLLINTRSALAAQPEAPLPEQRYPGGIERARWHMQRGLEVFERHFGLRPVGCWPSEGGVSLPTLQLLAEFGFSWTASGESVLRNSLDLHFAESNELRNETTDHTHFENPQTSPDACDKHRVYRFGDAPIDCFFRDDGLSDLVGFTYADWHADDAVANLIHHLERIADHCAQQRDSVVSIILDGENAWEYYPENGYYFLQRLYAALGEHPQLELTTFADVLQEQQLQRVHLPQLVAGSWVYGTFSTWIGSADKNRGWDLLIEAKHCYDEVLASGRLSARQVEVATTQLAICEGSDWFWWFGDYNPAASVSDFERLFRLHLGNLYRSLGCEAPAALAQIISHGGGEPEHGGVMLHGPGPAGQS